MPTTYNGIYTGGIVISPTASFPVIISSTSTVTNSADISGLFGVYTNNFVVLINKGLVSQYNGGAGIGIRLGDDASLTNAASGTIAGETNGVQITAGGTISNSGTIRATQKSGVAVTLYHGGTLSNAAGAVIAAGEGVLVSQTAGTISNSGTITAASAAGINLFGGGKVTNGKSGSTVGLIKGSTYGVYASGTVASTVTNFGTIRATATSGVGLQLGSGGVIHNWTKIESTGTAGCGVRLQNGGTLFNGSVTSATASITGVIDGVQVNGAAAAAVHNYATIKGTGAFSDGVYLQSGKLLTNGHAGTSAGLISGVFTGVEAPAAGATVSNFGSIIGTGTISTGLRIGANASVTNAGLISGQHYGILDAAAATVANTGTLSSAFGTGVKLHGGTVSNTGAGLIDGYIGVHAAGVRATIVNTGNIAGTPNFAVWLDAGGVVTNGQSTSPAGYIGGATGIYTTVGLTTVTNYGSIFALHGNAIYLNGGGTIRNGANGVAGAEIIGAGYGVRAIGTATVSNFGLVASVSTSGVGIHLFNGAVNNGQSGSGAGVISTSRTGIELAGAGRIDNYGTVFSTGLSSKTVIAHGALTLVNSGTLLNTGYEGEGVVTYSAANITNRALITASGLYSDAIVGNAAISLANTGTIAAGGSGIVLESGGTVTNGSALVHSASITGGSAGIATTGGATFANYGYISGGIGVLAITPAAITLTNSGTVIGTGGIAIEFSSGDDTLTLKAGSSITGAVSGGLGTDTATFTEPGSAAFAGFSGFESVNLAGTSANTLTLTDANFANVTGNVITIRGKGTANTVDASGVANPTNAIVYVNTGGTDSVTGGAGNDLFLFSVPTLALATLHGGAGADTLQLGSPGTLALTAVDGIETFILSGDSANQIALTDANFANVTASTIAIDAGSEGNVLDASAVGNAADAIVYDNAGAADSLTGGAGNDVFNFGAAALAASTIAGGAGNDALNITATGTTVSLAGVTGVEKINEIGSSLTLSLTDANFAGVAGHAITVQAGIIGTTVDASGVATAANRLIYFGGGGLQTVTGGAGNDTFELQSSFVAAATLDGGAGSDTLIVTTGGTIDATNVFGIERFATGGGGANSLTLTDANFTGIGGALITVVGGAADDAVDGSGVVTAGNRLVLNGGAGNDTLNGGAGNDTLNGGPGADTLAGGAGDDAYVVDNAGDVVTEASAAGFDTIRTTLASYTLGANVENLTFTGTGNFAGTGNAFANTITGGAGNDTLKGGAGNDTLDGRLGNDALTGGGARDSFLFDTALNAATNVDHIFDFSTVDDKIVLAQSVFAAAGGQGALASGAFVIGSAAADADDRIVYDSGTGALIYDANGNLAGGATQFATLSAGLSLTSNNFAIV